MNQKPPAQRDSSPPKALTPSGFQAKIRGVSLADLIQMECLAGSKLVVRVTSGPKVGYLYFRGGMVVHAVTATGLGEAAAMEMLSWNGGTFEPTDREWAKDTIVTSWQSLLLRAAQIRDEKEAGSVVTLHADGGEGRRGRSRSDASIIGESIEVEVTPIQVAGHTLRAEDVQVYLRMNADGAMVANHGSTQSFADSAAYAVMLGQLLGDQLGVDGFVSMECTFKAGPCFVVLEASGEVVVLEPRTPADAASLREMLKL
jgi:hypothetical protein